uniref:Uncharacterized protein n=1 Tax=Hyaloperonospora arabidopsidis (strain Emoy2) TaxID=559515 RepID=M4B3P6_HYAAE
MTGRKSAVPWLAWTEWQDVHEGLFSSDPYAQQRSISRVTAWRSRMQLPVAINATAQLVELQLHESMAQHHHHAIGVSSRSHMELSLLYANVIVRCVNGLVDSAQKGAYASAVSTLAQRIGIPLWVVDLRHESTHNQLPSLPVLRFAARHLLAWLRANYWGAQEDLIREQVHHVAQWLFEQLPHLHQEPSGAEVQVELIRGSDAVRMQTTSKLRLNVDNLRNVVGPLLVDGEQFRERVATSGLFFANQLLLMEGQDVKDVAEVFQDEMNAAVALLLRLQPLWRSFSASLLATLCQKVFDVICPPRQSRWSSEGAEGREGHNKQDDDTVETSEVEMTLRWIKFMASSEYREKVKLQIGPVEDLCHCGAEMLTLAENMKSDGVAGDREELLERLLAALRSSRAVRHHPLLATEAAIATSLASTSASDWTQLPAWWESPIGLRYCYTPCHALNQHQVREYALDDDSLMQDSTGFVASDEAVNKSDTDDVMDAVMEGLDAAYIAALQRILTLQATIARDGLRQGGSTTVLPKLELQRIQEEIEIW